MDVSKLSKNIQEARIAGINKKNAMIEKALQRSTMHNIREFIDVTGFELHEILPFDSMWNAFYADEYIYVTDDLIKAFGYKGELKTQKLSLMKLIKKYDIPTIQMNNEEYDEFLSSLQATHNLQQIESKEAQESNEIANHSYPPLVKSTGKGKTMHTLITTKSFKKLILVVHTLQGDAARDFVIALDELVCLYFRYQAEYRSRMLSIKDEKIDKLQEDMRKLLTNSEEQLNLNREMKESNEVLHEVVNEMNTKLDKSTDERAPRTKNAGKHEAFILTKVSTNPDKYYAIRCQSTTINRTIKKQKVKYPQLTVLLTIEYQPNSKNLYNLIKENIENIEFKRNNIELTDGYTEAQFIADIQALDYAKKELSSDDESE
jgi:hypothetical protein